MNAQQEVKVVQVGLGELVNILQELIDKQLSKYTSFNLIGNFNEEEKMNQKEAAKFIGVCEVTMCKYKKAGLVPHHTFPGSHKITYYKSELREFMHKRPDLLGVARK